MRLLSDDELGRSAVVANCRINRERDLHGTNGHGRELGLDELIDQAISSDGAVRSPSKKRYTLPWSAGVDGSAGLPSETSNTWTVPTSPRTRNADPVIHSSNRALLSGRTNSASFGSGRPRGSRKS
jgi:hypothetical protein